MASQPAHKWQFATRFRARAYGWRSSRLACRRIKEAVAEIRSMSRKDPVLAGDGAVRLLERLSPALEGVDSSSGALGNATSDAVDRLVGICAAAPIDHKTRCRWLDRLWEAVVEDGVGYLEELTGRWGDLCASPDVATKWADELLPDVRLVWSEPGSYAYYKGASACLSSLLAAGRHQEVLALLGLRRSLFWPCQVFGVRALEAMGRIDEAITYAQGSRGLNDSQADINAECERILLAAGRSDEAYERYALDTGREGTNISTFREIRGKYPNRDPEAILRDLVADSPGDEGMWFATAKDLKLYDYARDLAFTSPCDPRTLNRAARDFVTSNPHFALGVALASIAWILRGHGYDISSVEAREACGYARQAAGLVGATEGLRESVRSEVALSRTFAPIIEAVKREFGL